MDWKAFAEDLFHKLAGCSVTRVGHDAAVFAQAGIPTGMIFIRNWNGSHNPDEQMEIDDFMIGVELLYNTVKELGKS